MIIPESRDALAQARRRIVEADVLVTQADELAAKLVDLRRRDPLATAINRVYRSAG